MNEYHVNNIQVVFHSSKINQNLANEDNFVAPNSHHVNYPIITKTSLPSLFLNSLFPEMVVLAHHHFLEKSTLICILYIIP